jgi:hypothetical protein
LLVGQYSRLGSLHAGGKLKSIEHQGGLDGGMADGLVPPSMKGWFWISEKPRAAALAVNPG